KRHNIPLIEDCSQAHMTEYKGKYVGTIGDIGCFSFQQSKHMTTGDGGMTITSNRAYAERMKLFVDKNYARKGWGARAYISLAPNYRMNELTAAVGRAQLKKVKKVINRRHELGEHLTKLISGIPEIKTAPITEGASHGYWLYPLTLKGLDTNAFAEEMKKAGVWVSAGYTVKPIYLCTETLTNRKTYGTSGCPFTCKYTDKNYEYKEGLCPKAEEALKHLIGLPFDESWSMARIERAAQAVTATVQKLKGESKAATAETKPANVPVKAKAVDSKTIKIGVIGCGQMGEWHFSAYRNNPNVQMTAFVDTDISKTEPFAKKMGGKSYSSVKEMLKNEKLDGVSICTIPATHKDIVLDLLNAGVNVLCEKPLAISAAQAEDMTRKADEKKLLLYTAYKFRFFEEVLKAKELIDKEQLGNILSFRLMLGGAQNMSGTWYTDKALSGGGVIIDTASHALDLVNYLFGEVESVKTRLNKQQEIAVEDTANMELVLKKGGHGTIDISWSLPVPTQNYLEIFGTDGTALLDFKGITYKFKTWDEWKRLDNQRDSKQAFARQIDNFVNAIAGNQSKTIGNEDGLKAQRLIEEAYESIGGK
ncbi:MAG: DegT/DnrJ/EryC1/StrS family aminotransferase, partial [bacterium]|nr:DegT/DnrJ/EryC1/StrS family aminotransferase [bacterium]